MFDRGPGSSAQEPALSSTHPAPAKRWWPLAAYLLLCGLLAAFSQRLMWHFQVDQITLFGPLFGMTTGCAGLIVVIAAFCGSTIFVGLAAASLIASFLFAAYWVAFTWIEQHYYVGETLWQSFTSFTLPKLAFCFNLPFILLGASLPLIAFRWLGGWQLSRNPNNAIRSPIQVEGMFYAVTCAACVVFFCRVPMELLELPLRSVMVYLPGIALLTAATTLIMVLPTIRWAFADRPSPMQWFYVSANSAFGAGVLFPLFAVALGDWLGLGPLPPGGYVLAGFYSGVGAFVVYLLGVLALRKSGFRWLPHAQPAPAIRPVVDVEEDGASSAAGNQPNLARRWVTGYLAFAVLTAVIVNQVRSTRAQLAERIAARVANIKALGGEAYIVERAITGLRLPPYSTDTSLAELSDMKQLASITLSDTKITDKAVDQLQQFPALKYVDLSGTQVTDQGLLDLHGLKQLSSINISRLSISAQAVSQLLDNLPLIQSVSLADIGLSDMDAVNITKHHAVFWDVSGNQLTDAALENFWKVKRNFLSLDISRNPIPGEIFSQKPNLLQLTLKMDQVPVDDMAILQLLGHGLPVGLELGKTRISIHGLESILNAATSVILKEGSFDEVQLAQIPPVTSLSLWSLGLNSPAFTGQFLSGWTQLPQVLSFAKSAMTDQELANLPATYQPLQSLDLTDCPITDASLEKIAELNPRSLVLRDTRVTAQGLLQSKLQKTLIFLNQDQFTPAEWKQLNQNLNIGSGYFE